ncbi:MAG: hypothetical protein GF346_08290 [Candidatus Eisenbacteria bacterium]|nr:hypothetical protein [Candidatus Latescibacterota bacterium]MBD3302432.1 hypothetical protein [Candidatus Eisenbacteria bacterium]
MSRRIPGFVLVLALGTGLLAGPAAAAELFISSRPSGMATWANDRLLGRTPVWTTLPEGWVVLRLVEGNDSLYRPPAVDTLLHLAARETLSVHFRVGPRVTVRTEPFGIPLLRDGARIGETPVDLRLSPEGGDRLKLLAPGGPVEVPTDTLRARGSWTWRGEVLRIPSYTPRERPLWRKVGRYVLPGVAAALLAGGILVEDSADRAYDRYRHSVDPEEIERHYDAARTRDNWAAALWVGAEVSLASAVLAWILPEQRGGGAQGRKR